MEAAKALGQIKKEINIPLVADIHFDLKCALEAAKHVDKLRINPGNIGSKENTITFIKAAKDYGLPIRIGINGGSLEKNIVEKFGSTPKAAVESALGHIKILEENDFENILVSLKFHDALRTIEAYRLMSEARNYPLHVGVTEAGTPWLSSIKSSVGIGALLADGIGDTIRASVTGPLSDEIKIAFEILKSLGLREFGRTFTSCPTCGRTEIDIIGLAQKIEKLTENIKEPIQVAVMGCVVNGPGEAKEADIAIFGGKGVGLIVRKGKIIKTVPEKDLLDEFKIELDKLLLEKQNNK